MDGLCCGLDIGTTNLKAVLVDAAGRVRWSRSVPAVRTSEDGGAATPAPALLRAAEDLVIEGWRQAGEGRPLEAIATAGVGEDGLPLAADLSPLAPAIAWFDERAAGEAAELAASAASSPRLGLSVDRFRTAAKWLWLAKHRPDQLAASHVWVALTDYPAVAWSGRAFMSETLAARTAAYDVYRRSWHAPMLAAAKAPRLPQVLPAGTVVGPVIPGRLHEAGAADEETLVVAGGHDHPVAASFIRRFEPGAVVDSMGTAEVVYGEVPAPSVRRIDPRMAFSAPVSGGTGLACLGVFELAAALDPFRRSRHGDLVKAILDGETVPGSPRVTDRDGAIVDSSLLSGLEREGALLLAEEALTQAVRRGLALVEAIGAAGKIFTTGGWSRSDRFLQMRAACFGRSIFRFEEDELTGAGAALIAWSALKGARPPGLARPAVKRFDPPPGDGHAPRNRPTMKTNEEDHPWLSSG